MFASKKDREAIKDTLHMKNPLEVIGGLNRPNMFCKKAFRNGLDIRSYEEILKQIVVDRAWIPA